MKTFDGISIEDIVHCPDTEYSSGISARLLYAPASFFSKIDLPTDDADYENILKIKADNIGFQKNVGWGQIDILLDENELRTAIDGSAQRKKTKSSLEFFVKGFVEKNLGFVQRHKNTPFVFGIMVGNRSFLLGDLRNRAFFETAEATSGRKYEDNAGLNIKISANAPLYIYEDRLDMLGEKAAFSRAFSYGFR